MKRSNSASVLVLLILCFSYTIAADHHQVGAAGSGRSIVGNVQLVTIVGQTVSGTSGNLSSGFLALASFPTYVPGDADGSGGIDISDAIMLIQYIFVGGVAPNPLVSGDADCSGMVDISDAVFLIRYIFAGGAAPQFCS